MYRVGITLLSGLPNDPPCGIRSRVYANNPNTGDLQGNVEVRQRSTSEVRKCDLQENVEVRQRSTGEVRKCYSSSSVACAIMCLLVGWLHLQKCCHFY